MATGYGVAVPYNRESSEVSLKCSVLMGLQLQLLATVCIGPHLRGVWG